MPRSAASSSVPGLVTVTHIGGCGSCSGLGSTLRSGIEKLLPSPRERVLHPHLRQHAHELVPRLLGVVGVGPEAAELGPRRRPGGAELEPAARDLVEGRGPLGDADRMVHLGHAHDGAVADADALRLRRHRGQEHLGRRAVRVLLEEVVLDRPHVIEAELLGQPALLEGVHVHLVLGHLAQRPGHGQLEEDPEPHHVTLMAPSRRPGTRLGDRRPTGERTIRHARSTTWRRSDSPFPASTRRRPIRWPSASSSGSSPSSTRADPQAHPLERGGRATFIGVHEMLDPQVDGVRLMVDQTAERIATLGAEPNGLPGYVVSSRDLGRLQARPGHRARAPRRPRRRLQRRDRGAPPGHRRVRRARPRRRRTCSSSRPRTSSSTTGSCGPTSRRPRARWPPAGAQHTEAGRGQGEGGVQALIYGGPRIGAGPVRWSGPAHAPEVPGSPRPPRPGAACARGAAWRCGAPPMSAKECWTWGR